MTRPHPLTTVALLGVLVTGLLLVVTRPGPTSAVVEAGRVHTPHGSFVVGERWSATSPGAVLYYADASGGPVAQVAGAVLADAGYCPARATSHRGFAGFALSPTPGGEVVTSVRSVAAAWARGISGRSPPVAEPTRVVLADGAAALRVRVRVRTAVSTDPCVARRVVVDVVGLLNGAGTSAFVLVRDVDPRGVSDAEADKVVQSLRSRT